MTIYAYIATRYPAAPRKSPTEKLPLNPGVQYSDGQRPNSRGVHAALGTGIHSC
jgi:hypothetical protein